MFLSFGGWGPTFYSGRDNFFPTLPMLGWEPMRFKTKVGGRFFLVKQKTPPLLTGFL
jgi:hypothetical protein